MQNSYLTLRGACPFWLRWLHNLQISSVEMKSSWSFNAEIMIYQCRVHDLSMQSPWFINAESMIYQCRIHDWSMQNPWLINAESMIDQCCKQRTSVCAISSPFSIRALERTKQNDENQGQKPRKSTWESRSKTTEKHVRRMVTATEFIISNQNTSNQMMNFASQMMNVVWAIWLQSHQNAASVYATCLVTYSITSWYIGNQHTKTYEYEPKPSENTQKTVRKHSEKCRKSWPYPAHPSSLWGLSRRAVSLQKPASQYLAIQPPSSLHSTNESSLH